MAFLNFIFKDKQGDDAPEQAASAPVVEEVEEGMVGERVTEAPPAEAPSGNLGNADEMDLDQLVEALQLISEFLDEVEAVDEEQSPEACPENAVSIPFTLEQVSDLLTNAFDQQAVAKYDTSKMVNVSIEDVFAQLGRGRVTTPVKRLLASVPPELVKKGFDRFSEDEVSLPLALVVSAVQPAELANRTAGEDTAPDLDSMPDLFASGRGPAPVEVEEVIPEPAAPAPALNDMADPFSLAASATTPSETVEDGTLKFELNDDANIFNFSASPVNEAPAEAAPPVEEPAEELTEEWGEEVAASASAEDEIDLEPAGEEIPEPVAEEETMPETVSVDEMDETEEPVLTEKPSQVFGPAVIGEDILAEDRLAEDSMAVEDEALVATGDGRVVLFGLDLNQADAQQMSNRLDGVGPRLAERIVRHREINGPFRSKSDLARVRGVGPSTYRKMTGLSWSEARDSLMRTLDYVLGTGGQGVPDLKAMARRIHSLSGFEGCVFVHSDGHMLAASWDDDKQDVLGAVAPQILKKLSPYVDELDIGDLNPLTLCLGDMSICFAQSGNLIMATVHRGTGLGRRQTRLIELLSSELEQRFEVTMEL